MFDVMSDDLIAVISQGMKDLNIELPPGTEAAFRVYYDFLNSHRKNVNLTAITGVEETARLHFLDSLALLNSVEFENINVIDIGSGAGFPGVPLKLAKPSIELTLLDATGKRIAFLTKLCEKLDIEAICVQARAEEAAHIPNMRQQYDIAVSRAVARLNVLCELCLPFVRNGGLFLAMKTVDSEQEVEDAKNAINILGGKLQRHYDYAIPGTDISHRVIIIKKETNTPEVYPRRYSKITKAPL
jgi:16S rRNA (guanine527-N7)-methyltransferase